MTCGGCEREFEPRRWNQKFCVPACRAQAWRKDRVLTATEAKRRDRGRAARRSPRIGSRTHPLQVRQCPVCRRFWLADASDDLRCREHREAA